MPEMAIFRVFFVLVFSCVGPSLQKDKTMEPRELGHDVVSKVVTRIDASDIFAQDNNFLHRIAWFVSRDGEDRHYYGSDDFHGGIWPVEKANFYLTQQKTSLAGYRKKIFLYWGLDWTSLKWKDLETPFYSGLAARLCAEMLSSSIPLSLANQANYFVSNYENKTSKYSAAEFTEKNMEHERNYRCVAKRDLCFILDSSGSVGRGDHKRSLEFIWAVVEAMALGADETRVSQVTYSNDPMLTYADIFNATVAEEKIFLAPFIDSVTETGEAIQYAIDNVYEPYFRKNEPGIVEVFIVLTDGQSDDDVVLPSTKAAKLGITVISVGIGPAINSKQLLAVANYLPENVFRASFDKLGEIRKLLEDATCSTPAEIFADGAELKYTVGPTTSTYFKVKLPRDGVKIRIRIVKGTATGYVSYSEETPNSAVYDAVLLPGKWEFFPYKARRSLVPKMTNFFTTYIYVGVISRHFRESKFILQVTSDAVSASPGTFLLLVLLCVQRIAN